MNGGRNLACWTKIPAGMAFGLLVVLNLSLEALAQGSYEVDARANVFGATAGSLSDGNPPTVVPLPVGRSRFVVFAGATGTVSCCSGAHPNGPKGGDTFAPTRVTSSHPSLSNMSHDSLTMFLAGVFLGADEPQGSAPPTLNYPDPEPRRTLSPLLNQVFYIGDGMGAGGALQRYSVPEGATRILLGFADAGSFGGEAAAYADNTGSISLSVRVDAGPELMTVEIIDADSLEPVANLAVGGSFRVRLTYDRAHETAHSEDVTIRSSSGVAVQTVVSGEGRVILSDPVGLVPLVTP